MKFFYHHLIDIELVIIELDKLDLSNEQKMHLSSLVDSSLHNIILDAILSELSPEDKRSFLYILKEGKSDNTWQFLCERVDKIEDKIKAVAEQFKLQLHKDLQESKKYG